MKVNVKHWHAVAHWRWDTGAPEQDDPENEGDVCGICRVPYEGCCPSCKMPGDDCPLSACWISHIYAAALLTTATVWGECTHVFHMHCLLKWIGTAASKQQCPMDRRTWGTSRIAFPWSRTSDLYTKVTAERKVRATAKLSWFMKHRLWPVQFCIDRSVSYCVRSLRCNLSSSIMFSCPTYLNLGRIVIWRYNNYNNLCRLWITQTP